MLLQSVSTVYDINSCFFLTGDFGIGEVKPRCAGNRKRTIEIVSNEGYLIECPSDKKFTGGKTK